MNARCWIHLGFLPLVLFGWDTTVVHTDARPSAQEILERVEDNLRSRSSHGELVMTIVKKEWTRTLRFEFWEKGRDRMLVRVLAPPKERGMASLKVGTNLWNYIPAIERVMKLPPSMMGSSWMGSHFTNDDIVRETSLARDYRAGLLREDATLYVLNLRPRPEAPVVWARIEIDIRKDVLLPVAARYFDERDRLVRRLVYQDIRPIDHRQFPFHWVLYPVDKPGEYTELRVIRITFDIDIPDRIFSIRYLTRARR